MINRNIVLEYLESRKASYIKDQLKTNKSDTEEEIQKEADQKFEFENFIANTAKKAKSYSIGTHNGKYTHTLAQTSPIYYTAPESSNKDDYGLLVSGLVDVEEDAFGSAASMPAYRFLNIPLSDSKTILDHLKEDTEEARELFDLKEISYEELRDQFLKIIFKDDEELFTDYLMKQILFPVEDTYYVFTPMTASGLAYETKNRIDAIRFAKDEKTVNAKKKKRANEYCEDMYVTISDLTQIIYGGSKSRNVGSLNVKAGGKGILLSSVPPNPKEKTRALPRQDFLKTLFVNKRCKDRLALLKRQSENYYSNININEGRKQNIANILNHVLDIIFEIRSVELGWSVSEQYENLPTYQVFFLDDIYESERDYGNLKNEFIKEIALWVCKKIGKLDDENLRSEVTSIAKTVIGEAL